MEIELSALSLLPSLCAIVIALVTRQVFVAMFAGVWLGAWLIEGAGMAGLVSSFFGAIDQYVLRALVPKDGSSDHMSIVLFSLMTGAMIGVLSRNGGMRGIVDVFIRIADTPRKGQSATFGLGGIIFFDDYANTLIVGNTMRPLTDALKISRAKLAFLVDSTAAPIACIAVVTTWVGFQVSLIEDSLKGLPLEVGAFELVLASIPYSFYPLLMLWFIAVMIVTQKDFGPMLKAEKHARQHGSEVSALAKKPAPAASDEFLPHEAKPLAINAVLPILVFVGATVCGLAVTGEGESLREVLGSADPFKSVLWSATAGLATAIAMSLITKRLNVTETMEALEQGMQPMLLAVMILTFAWAIADVNTDLKTADYIISAIGEHVSPSWLPLIVFLIAALTSFATGSSWSTMGILVPLALPLSYNLLAQSGVEHVSTHPLMLASIASVLTGAVWGDHCSPISDTTILSSMSSGCDHIEHVRTQMPYAMVVATMAMVCGLIPLGLGMPWWVGMLIGAGAIVIIFRLIGQRATND